MILSVGEILVDQIEGLQKAGGAPFNVAVNAHHLGADVIFVGSVGNDEEGKFLINKVKEYGLNPAHIRLDKERKTTKAIVTLENGERSFRFERDNTADAYLEEISEELINKADIIHIGSLMLCYEEGRNYMSNLIELAHEAHKEVSFDVNYREDIYESKEEAIRIAKEFILKSDIIKLSEDEVELLGEEFIDSLKSKMVFITLGSRGSECHYINKIYKAESIFVNPVDTTGAGDAFMGAMLYMLDTHKDMDLEHSMEIANQYAALSTLHLGAIDVLPSF